jgi:hypothetical protein
MASMRRARSVAVTGVLALGAVGVGAAGGAVGAAGAAGVPTKDQFSGSISSATGRYRSDHGRLSIELSVSTSAKTTRHMTLIVRGASCGKTHHCLALSARLSGSVTRHAAAIPDIGASDTLRASGAVKPLGQTSVSGTIEGTGMIGRGHETMVLTLTTHSGKLTIGATSPIVPGFTLV